jgi:hypothetical protein
MIRLLREVDALCALETDETVEGRRLRFDQRGATKECVSHRFCMIEWVFERREEEWDRPGRTWDHFVGSWFPSMRVMQMTPLLIIPSTESRNSPEDSATTIQCPWVDTSRPVARST